MDGIHLVPDPASPDDEITLEGDSGAVWYEQATGRAVALNFAGEDGRRVSLPVDALDTLRLAYAATVHKAQGSQARAIVVPIFRGHQIMLTRNLVYTAVTRAQEVCVVVGERPALAQAVLRTDARRRHTRLRELVVDG